LITIRMDTPTRHLVSRAQNHYPMKKKPNFESKACPETGGEVVIVLDRCPGIVLGCVNEWVPRKGWW
jgi:hypothetical protein